MSASVLVDAQCTSQCRTSTFTEGKERHSQPIARSLTVKCPVTATETTRLPRLLTSPFVKSFIMHSACQSRIHFFITVHRALF